MLNLPLIEEWCVRLEDPSLSQCTGRLEDEFGAMCCLGVGSRLAVDKGIISAPILDTSGLGEVTYIWGDPEDPSYQYEIMPEPVWQAFGFTDGNPTVEITQEMVNEFDLDYLAGGTRQLSDCNDEYHMSFPEIAAAIRHTYLNG